MANRPRLPNVDPEDLAKLANQYPGSRSSGDTGSATSGSTATSGASGSGASGLGASGSGPSLSASASSRSSGSASGGPAGGGSAGGGSSSASQPAKKRGSWSAAFLTFLFALVAVVAALAAIGAPSYRGEIHRLLTQYGKPYLANDTIDILSGYDTQRLEVTYEGLDQRIEQLNQALERIAAVEGVSGDDARALLFRDQTAEKLDELNARLAALAEESGARDSELAAAAETASTDLQSAIADLQGSLDAVREEAATARADLDGLATRLTTAEGSVEEQAALNAEMAERFEAIDTRLSTLVSDFNALLDLSDQVAQTVATFKNENMPILAIIQLRDAVNRSEPFEPELAFAKRVLNGAAGIKEALAKLSATSSEGIASTPELRRDLRLIANNLGSFVTKVESWSDRVSGWFNTMVGVSTIPEARRGGGLAAAVATMDEALERDDMELVIREGVALQSELRSGALADWLNAVVQRVEVTDAVRKLERVVYTQATAPGDNQGTGKVQ